MKTQSVGDQGEIQVCELVKCPNCLGELITLPKNFPMFDIQCAKCMFRAQVKTVQNKPSSTVRGAGWDIYEKVLKAGYLPPPLILNFKWKSGKFDDQEIRFYPFIPRINLKQTITSSLHRQPNYKMFYYTGLDKIPYYVLHSKLH